MLRYVFYRLFLYVPTLLIILLVVFILMRALPGDPIRVMYGEFDPPPEVREELEKKLGLDRPLLAQYVLYVMRVLQGDWGKSVGTGEPVLQLVLRRFQATLELTVASIVIATVVGLSMALISVGKPNSLIDKTIRVLSVASYSIPVFWWGLVLILIFAVYLQLLPPGERGGLKHLILPAITLGVVNFGMIARVSRASMLETATQDYVIAARARGLSEFKVILGYIMRNAIVPIITIIGLRFGILMGGAVITETVFKYPGIGSMIYDAILARDYPVVFGGILFVAIVVMTVNLLIDILYYLVDPRVKLE
ncbi:MAG: ABC transporter permease, partial [Acidilobaceae archaeon]